MDFKQSTFFSEYWTIIEELTSTIFKILNGISDLKTIPNYVYEKNVAVDLLPEDEDDHLLSKNQKEPYLIPEDFSDSIYTISVPKVKFTKQQVHSILRNSFFTKESDLILSFSNNGFLKLKNRVIWDFNKIASRLRKRSKKGKGLVLTILWRDLAELSKIPDFILKIKNVICHDKEVKVVEGIDITLTMNKNVYGNNTLFLAFDFAGDTLDRVQTANVEQLISTVTHDMRTPLMGIIENLRIVHQKINKGKGTSIQSLSPFINVARTSSLMLDTMVNDILDSARISQGIFKIDSKEFNFQKTVKEVLDLMHVQIGNNDIILHMSFQGTMRIKSDELRIKQVIVNFLTNSIKFTRKGFIQIEVEEFAETKKIIISDTGSGIKEEDVGSLFDKFSSRRESKNRKGIGLGLFICKSIINILGPAQNIEVDTKLGQGTTFSFEIYKNIENHTGTDERTGKKDEHKKKIISEILAEDINVNTKLEEEAKLKQNKITTFQVKGNLDIESRSSNSNFDFDDSMSSGSDIPEVPRGSIILSQDNNSEIRLVKIVMLDDDQMILNLVKIFIENCFSEWEDVIYSLETFSYTCDALEYLKKHEVDIMFVDYCLQDMFGEDFVREMIKEKPKNFKKPMFILASGIEDLEELKKDLFDGTLRKPFNPLNFAKVLRDQIDNLD